MALTHCLHHCRKETLIMGVMHEINENTQRRRTGNSNKAVDSLLKRKWKKLHALVDEYAALEVMGTDNAPKVLSEEQKATLLSGASPWQWNQTVGARFFGKDIHRLRADVQRCKEELEVLPVEKRRLEAWMETMFEAIEDRFANVMGMREGDSEYAIRGGLAIHLGLFQDKVLTMKEKVDQMEWGKPRLPS